MEMGKIFYKIFGEQIIANQTENSANNELPNSSSESLLPECVEHLESWLTNKIQSVETGSETRPNPPNRIGPDKVAFTFQPDSAMRSSTDRLTIQSQGTFSTVKANTCVYGGKWMYELQLQSKGVMQIGWCSNKCVFSSETGVGDTKISYGFDGSKQQLWHIYTTKYGELWHSGDIIGVSLDVDAEKIEYYRNGTSMGVAFTQIERGPGIVLYPAVSLAFNEGLKANFGGTPFRFPIDGYEPLQSKPDLDLLKAELLLGYIVNLAGIMSKPKNRKDKTDKRFRFKKTVHSLVASHLVSKIAPHILNPYVVEDKLLLYFRNLCVLRSEADKDAVILPGSLESTLGTLLTLLWTYMEDEEMKAVMKMLLNQLLSMFCQTPTDLEYELQRKVIVILTCICNHPRSRKFYIEYKFFKKNCLPLFLYLRPPEYSVMVKLLPDDLIWTRGIGGNKDDYLAACEKLKKAVQALYGLQKNLLLNLLNNSDGDPLVASSRKIFLVRLRKYTMDNSLEHRAFFLLQGNYTYPIESPIALSFLCILVDVTKHLFQKEILNKPAAVDLKSFIDGTLKYQHFDRVGGVISHLRKVHKNDIVALYGDYPQAPSNVEESDLVRTDSNDVYSALFLIPGSLNRISIVGRRHDVVAGRMQEMRVTPDNVDPLKSLHELLDLCVIYYYAAGHKHVVKIVAIRDEIESLNNVLLETKQYREDVEKNLSELSADVGSAFDTVHNDILAELKEKFGERKSVFAKRSIELGRKQAWYRSVALGKQRRSLLIWLLDKNLLSLKAASEAGPLFTFVPEVYVNILPLLLDAILDFSIHDVTIQFELKDAETVIQGAAEFLGLHAADPRIILAACKDALLQAIGNLLSHADGINSMERSSANSQILLIKALLRPYENRAWGQSNWLLLRFWLGHGFAYRESRPPSVWQGSDSTEISLGLYRTRTKNESHTGLLHHIAPAHPSRHYQKLIGQHLTENEPFATAFLNSVLSQLNWAFSEFVLLLQEIQSSTNRQEGDIVFEPRQLKICSMCFELTVSLMRALEMVMSVAPAIFKDPARPNSDLILNRICQLISQVLSRVTVPPGSFQYIVDMCLPDLSSVTHFAIISAALGILLALLKEEMNDNVQPVKVSRLTRSLLTDPSFQIANIEFALGEVKTPLIPQPDIPRGNFDPKMRGHIDPLTNDFRDTLPSTSKRIRADPPILKFSLKDYPSHVSEEELEDIQNLINMLSLKQTLLSDITLPSEDSLCPICCAKPISATFQPCNHQSCSNCILQHLMNSKLCFYCKSAIKDVVKADGTVIYSNPNYVAGSAGILPSWTNPM